MSNNEAIIQNVQVETQVDPYMIRPNGSDIRRLFHLQVTRITAYHRDMNSYSSEYIILTLLKINSEI